MENKDARVMENKDARVSAESYAAVAHEEQREGTGSDMGAGDGLVHHLEDLLRRLLLVEQLDKIIRVLVTVGVSDADDLGFGILHQHIVALGKGVDSLLPADDLGKVDYLAVLVAL